MDHPEGAGSERANRLNFVCRIRLEFNGLQISSDGGLPGIAQVGKHLIDQQNPATLPSTACHLKDVGSEI